MNWIQGLCGSVAGLAILVGCESQHSKPAPATAPAISARAIAAAAVQHGPSFVDLTGGQLGIGGGFLIGAAPERVQGHQTTEAVAAAQLAEQAPARMELVRNSTTADLNHDGFVTLDEVLAMVRSGLSDSEVVNRLSATHYVFRITPEQQRYLTDRGVSEGVVAAIVHLSDSSNGSGTAGQ